MVVQVIFLVLYFSFLVRGFWSFQDNIYLGADVIGFQHVKPSCEHMHTHKHTIHTRIRTNTHTHTHTNTTHTYTHTNTNTRTHTQTHAHTHKHAIHTYKHKHKHTHKRTHKHTYTNASFSFFHLCIFPMLFVQFQILFQYFSCTYIVCVYVCARMLVCVS